LVLRIGPSERTSTPAIHTDDAPSRRASSTPASSPTGSSGSPSLDDTATASPPAERRRRPSAWISRASAAPAAPPSSPPRPKLALVPSGVVTLSSSTADGPLPSEGPPPPPAPVTGILSSATAPRSLARSTVADTDTWVRPPSTFSPVTR
jgi:cellulose 1,4-beta-cellobiosidase